MSTDEHSSGIPEPAPFPLVRFFMAASLVIVVGATVVLVSFLSAQARRELVDRSKSYAELLIQKIDYELHNEFVLPARAAGRSIDLEHDEAQRIAFDEVVRKAIYGLDVFSLKLWSREGRLIYSTDEAEVGLDALEEQPKIAQALEGATVYHLELEEEEPGGATLVEVFVPIHELERRDGAVRELVPTTRIFGVLEVYFEVDDLVAQIRKSQLLITGVLVGIMLLVQLLLWLTVRRGERLFAEKTRQREALEERLHEAEHVAGLSMLMAGIAHEIRTPLGVVSSLAETLQSSALPDDKRTKLLAALVEESDRMNGLVTRFLEFGRPSRPDLLACDIATELEAIIEQLEQRAGDRAVALTVEIEPELPEILCEPGLLDRVLVNLVANAIDACPPEGGRIDVVVRKQCQPDGPACVAMSVTDNGAGVPVEERERIFKPFHSTKEAGIGLGLALVAKLVEAIGGTVHLENPEQGARFVVRFALAHSAR